MVSLRAKKQSSGTYHLYIDNYKDGKRIKTYLKIYVKKDYTRPLTDKKGVVLLDKKGNPQFESISREDKLNWELAQKIRTQLENDALETS